MEHLLQQYWKHSQNARVAAPLCVIYVWMCSRSLCFYYSQSVLKLVGHPLCVAISGIFILQIYVCIYVCFSCVPEVSTSHQFTFLIFSSLWCTAIEDSNCHLNKTSLTFPDLTGVYYSRCSSGGALWQALGALLHTPMLLLYSNLTASLLETCFAGQAEEGKVKALSEEFICRVCPGWFYVNFCVLLSESCEWWVVVRLDVQDTDEGHGLPATWQGCGRCVLTMPEEENQRGCIFFFFLPLQL